MDIRVGDRFKYYLGLDDEGNRRFHVWEYVGPGDYDFVVVESTNSTRPIGYKYHIGQSFKMELYTYLGNYAKSKNFSDLFSILNESYELLSDEL